MQGAVLAGLGELVISTLRFMTTLHMGRSLHFHTKTAAECFELTGDALWRKVYLNMGRAYRHGGLRI